jgi:hypothetical protein
VSVAPRKSFAFEWGPPSERARAVAPLRAPAIVSSFRVFPTVNVGETTARFRKVKKDKLNGTWLGHRRRGDADGTMLPQSQGPLAVAARAVFGRCVSARRIEKLRLEGNSVMRAD